MFNVIIIGAEDTNNYNFFKEKTIKFLSRKAKSGEGITIYTTGDEYIDTFSKRFGIDERVFYTDWKSNGKDALKIRDNEILETANAIIFFQNNKKDFNTLFDQARKKNLPFRLVTVD